jgi:protocatechuate 3,4-dioxygenase beta subunit
MQKRSIPIVIFTLFFLLVAGTWFTYHENSVWADDYYGLTVDFNGAEASKDIKVLIEIFEYTPGMTILGLPVIQAVTNTKSSLNTPTGALSLPLPKGRKFLLRAEPLVGRTVTNGQSSGSYQLKEANYQSQFYNKERTFQKAIDDGYIIDTGGGAATGIKTISLEPGYKIEGSITPCESSGSFIEGVMVKVYSEDKVPTSRYGKSAATGGLNKVNYSVYGLSPGKYYLLADGPSKGYMRRFYKGSTGTDTLDDAELIEIKGSDISGKNICLNHGRTVKGTLFTPDGSIMQHSTTVYLLDAVYSVPVGVYLFDPNSPAYDEFVTRLNYYLSGGMVDISYSKNDPHYSIGGLDPNYSIAGSPKGFLGQCILVGVDPRGEYAPNVYNGHYFAGDADRISLKDVTSTSTFDLHFKQAATIAGTVKDKTGVPLPSVVVKAVDGNNESNVIQPIYTDPNGRYKFVGLPPMDYKVQVSDDVNHKYLWQYYQNKSNFVQANKVQLTEQNLNASHIDFEMEIGGKIAGSVKEASTQAAIAGMTIQAFLIGNGSSLENYPIATTASGAGITDSSGNYEITGLPLGQYVLYARPSVGDNHTAVFYKDSDILNGADSNLVIDHPGQSIGSCDFLLKKGAIIQGKITGVPPEIKVNLFGNMHVDLMDATTGKLMQSTTENIDPNTFGYTIMGIPKGEYKIAITDLRMPPDMLKKYYNKENASKGVFTFKEASILEIDPAANSMQIDFNWDKVGESVSGKVLADNPEQTPVLNVKIEAFLVDGTSGELLNTGIYDRSKTAGMYCVKGLAAGTYVLKAIDDMNLMYPSEFYDPGYNTFTPDKAARITLPLSNANVSYDFKLNSQIGIIDGVVTKGTEKSPFPGSIVYLYDVESDQIYPNPAITDPNGRYRFTGLAEGGYKIRAFDSGRTYVPRFYTSNSAVYAFSSADGEGVRVKYADPSSSMRKDISMDKQSTQIAGTVKNRTGSILPDIFIYLYQQSGDKWLFISDYYTVTTNSDGKYTIKGLSAGTYRVLAWDYNNKYNPNNQDVTFDQQGKTSLDFTLSNVDTGAQAAKYTIDISAGLNLFSFPTRVPLWPSLYTANNLISEWTAADDPGVVSILRLNTEIGKWENQLSNFLIENGDGYIVYSHADKKITYSGDLFPGKDSFAINLQKGMNFVGNIKSGTSGYDSYAMLKKLPSNKVYDIRSYDPVRGKWLNSTLFWGRSGGDRFPVYPTKAYIVDMKESHLSWLP